MNGKKSINFLDILFFVFLFFVFFFLVTCNEREREREKLVATSYSRSIGFDGGGLCVKQFTYEKVLFYG